MKNTNLVRSPLALGIDNIDLMANDIRTVVVKIAVNLIDLTKDWFDTNSSSKIMSTGEGSKWGYLMGRTITGRRYVEIYYDKTCLFSAGGYHQPRLEEVEQIFADLPIFERAMCGIFPGVYYKLRPFLKASGDERAFSN